MSAFKLSAAVLFGLQIASSATAAQMRFDLICSGTYVKDADAAIAWRERYRVDLLAKQYCLGSCNAIFQLGKISPTILSFHWDMYNKFKMDGDTVDRKTGRYSRKRYSYSTGSEEWSGDCKPIVFSGFPKNCFSNRNWIPQQACPPRPIPIQY